jgi:alanine-glyoxylate transaminase/(R)-3-amino-2-methylpropionate-pyruvate transaminase
MQNPKTTASSNRADETRRKHDEYLFPAVANYYREPIVLVSGQGHVLTDSEGREYLDFFGGILTVSVGHGNARVLEAIQNQLERVVHTSSLYPTEPVVDLAETLARITPGGLKKTYFTCSGTEADETAVMMAQLHTGHQEIIALRHGYSGRSLLAQSLTGHASWRAVPAQVAAVRHAPAPYCYRCPLGKSYPSCGVACARDLEELIRTTTTGRVAGFLAEPILGVGGFITPPDEYFQIAVEIVRRHGGVFICDEVQTGFGRTGGKMWGIGHYGVEPEIMTMAKGIANGLPLSATVTTDEIAEALRSMTISTFGGNPVSCAAAGATVAEIEERNLLENADAMGTRLRKGLEELQEKHPARIGEVRGRGLMQGVEIVKDEAAGDRTPDVEATLAVMEETKRRDLLIGRGGLYGNALRIAPPLTISSAEIDRALEALDGAFASVPAA